MVRRFKLRRRGFSLLELGMVLAIIALIIGGIFYFYGTVVDKRRTVETIQEITAIDSLVNTYYVSATGSDVGLSAAVLAKSGLLPSKWVSNGQLISPYLTPITVTDLNGNIGNQWYITITGGLSNAACVQIAMTDFQTMSGKKTLVNGNAINGSVAFAEKFCKTGGNSITIYFD